MEMFRRSQHYWRNRLSKAGLATIAVLFAFTTLPAQQPSEAELDKLAAQMDKALGLRPGLIVADIGTGAAMQHPIRIAREVAPDGKVVSVEVSQSSADRIKKRIDAEQIVNMEVLLGKEDDPTLAPGAFDAILISNTYHEFSHPEAMLKHIREALKPDGVLVVVENYSIAHRADSRAAQAGRHDMAPETLERELTAAGFAMKERVEPVLVNSPDRLRYLVRAGKK
jgi:ubiquinone/menaquinone biosynthesis C-methylase UbiE